MEELKKKVEKAKADRAKGTRVETAPTIQSAEWHEVIEKETGVKADWFALVQAMGPKGCRVQNDEFAISILCVGPEEFVRKVGQKFQQTGFHGDRCPFDLALVRLNSWSVIPFEVGPKTEMIYEEEEMQLMWDQKAGDVDLVGGMQEGMEEGVRRYFAGFK